MAQGQSGAGRPRKRKLSKRKRAMYRRRRIVAALVLAVLLATAVFCVVSISRGVGAVIGATYGSVDRVALERGTSPTPHRSTGVKDCSTKDTRLELTAKTASASVGGSIEFVATIRHEGVDSCLVDASDSGRVLTITSGDDTVWRSDSCPVDARMLLMAKGDKDIQSMTWGANRTGDECVEDQAALPNVERGTYVARLSLANNPKVTSEPVTVEVR